MFDKKARLVYGAIELANFEVETVNGWYFKGKPMLVLVSRERLSIQSYRGSPLVGPSRTGECTRNCPGETHQGEDHER